MKNILKSLAAVIITITGVFFRVNAIYADNPITVAIPVETDIQTIIRISPLEGAPAPETSELNIDKSGKGEFKIGFTDPGTYVYKISQDKGNDPNISYDTTVYDVTVAVFTDDQQNMSYKICVNKEKTDTKTPKIVFKNTRPSDEGPKPSPSSTPVIADPTKSHNTSDSSGMIKYASIMFISVLTLLVAGRIRSKIE